MIGRRASAWVYAAFLGGAYAIVAAGCWWRILPPAALLALLTLVLAVPTAVGVLRRADDIPELVSYMGRNVLVVLLTPALLALGLLLSRGIP